MYYWHIFSSFRYTRKIEILLKPQKEKYIRSSIYIILLTYNMLTIFLSERNPGKTYIRINCTHMAHYLVRPRRTYIFPRENRKHTQRYLCNPNDRYSRDHRSTIMSRNAVFSNNRRLAFISKAMHVAARLIGARAALFVRGRKPAHANKWSADGKARLARQFTF